MAVAWIQAKASVIAELWTHILNVFLDNCFEERKKLVKLPIVGVVIPTLDVDSVVRLRHKVL